MLLAVCWYRLKQAARYNRSEPTPAYPRSILMKGPPSPRGELDPQALQIEPLPELAGMAESLGAPYGLPFWFAYIGNLAIMVAISLLYRYSDYVKVLGGTETDLGWIVGVGMVGSLVMRLAQGVCIIRIGARQVWFWSVAVFAAVCFAHRLVETVDGPAVYVLQIIFRSAVAGTFGASITYVSSRVPVSRVAEVIGMLGTSGFLGMLGGTLIGDYGIFGAGPIDRWHVDAMFDVAGLLGVIACVFSLLATRGEIRPQIRRQPPLLWLLRRYHPGVLLLVAVGVGIGVNLPTAYLRPFTETLGISGIMVFFWVYAPTAFITRFLTRRAPEQIGIRPMVMIGLSCLALSVVLYLVVSTTWHLVIPGLLAGFAHAFLFPSVTGGGSTSFPTRYRGLGVTVMLAMFDLGNLIGAPMAGMMLYGAEAAGLPPYPTMFLGIASLLALICTAYLLNSRHHKGPGLQRKRTRKRRTPAPRPIPQGVGTAVGDGALDMVPHNASHNGAAESALSKTSADQAQNGHSREAGDPAHTDNGHDPARLQGEKCPG